MAVSSYTDFTFYSTTYLGAAIASTDFARLELRASAVIDQLTFDRAKIETDTDIIELIEMAVCAVAEEIQTQESNGNIDGVTSERVGNYSVSFGANAKAALTNEQKLEKAARLYLASTGLMYRGFASEENEN